jgi:hypothetical protein
MARKKSDERGEAFLGTFIIAVIFLLPMAISAAVEYIRLRNRYIVNREVVRIVNLGRAFQRTIYGIVALVLAVAGTSALIAALDQSTSNISILLTWIGLSVSSLLMFSIAVLTGKAFAAGMLGVVIDRGAGEITFPTDAFCARFLAP